MDGSLNLLERSLHIAAKWALVFLVVALPVPAMAGAGIQYLLVPAALSAVVGALTYFEPPEARAPFVRLAILGFAWSWLILLVLALAQVSVNAVVLGPDGVLFLEGAGKILSHRFRLPLPSYVEFETYATGHLYLFAGVLAVLGPALFSLQVTNCALTALLGPLTFAWVRTVWPRAALPAGLLVTVYPSIIYLSAVDLWKDPSIIAATSLVIWVLAHITQEKRWSRVGILAILGGACLAYLHVSRFYVAGYLELGTIVAGAAALLHRRGIKLVAVAGSLAVLTIGEAVPVACGWPTTPELFVAGVTTVRRAPSLKQYTAGFLDRAQADGMARGHSEGDVRAVTEAGTDRSPTLFGGRSPTRVGATHGEIGHSQDLVQVEIASSYAVRPAFGSAQWFRQMARRIWGPFVWILPPTSSVRDWLDGDYLLYPGMLFWYVLLPAMTTGLLVAAWRIINGREPFIVAIVAVFAGCYALQFLVINLPYRQREALFPVLVIFVLVGCEWLYARRWALWAYGAYWVGLIAIAVTHLSMRAYLLR